MAASAVLSLLEQARLEGRDDATVARERGGPPEAVRAALGRLAATGHARTPAVTRTSGSAWPAAVAAWG